MKEGRILPVIQPAPDAGLSRRAALQTLAAGIGASIAVPGLAEANDHPVHKHAAHVAEQAKKPAAGAKAAPYTPVTFDAHQFATVVVLSDLIVPGAKASGTPEFLDKLLHVESPETRRQFITALGAMEGAALKAHRKPRPTRWHCSPRPRTPRPAGNLDSGRRVTPSRCRRRPPGQPPSATTSTTSRAGCRASTSRRNRG